MNKLFNKLRKNRVLSMLLALAMLISLLPFNTVLANTVSGNDVAGYGMRTVSPTDAGSTFTMKPAPTVTYNKASSGYTVSTDDASKLGVVKYQQTASWGAVQYTVADHDYRYYDKVEIKITPSRAGMLLQIQDQDSWLGDFPAENTEQQTITIPLTKNMTWLKFFIDSTTVYSGAEVTATIDSVTFIESENPPTGDEEEEIPVPTVNPGVAAFEGTITDVTTDPNYAGDVAAVEFASGGNFAIKIDNHNATKYSQAEIEITPSRAGMTLAIANNWDVFDGWNHPTLQSGEKQTITVNLTGDVTYLRFFPDSYSSTSGTVRIHSVKFIDPNAPAEPTGPQTMAEITEIECESGYGFKIDEATGSAVYANAESNANKLRARAYVPADYTFTVGDVITINYETNISGIGVSYGFHNNNLTSMGTLSTDETSLTYTVEDVSVFDANTDNADEFFRFSNGSSGTADANSYLTVSSITITRGGAEEEDGPTDEPVIPAWQVKDGPKVTLNTENQYFNCVVNSDKSVNVTYTAPVGWHELVATVENCDYTKYSHVIIDITPAEDMQFYIYDDAGGVTSDSFIFDSADKTKFEFDLKQNTNNINIWIDPEHGSGQQEFIIHSIKIVDPTAPPELPESKAKFTDFSGTEADPSDVRTPINFTTNEAGGIADFTFNQGYTLRLYANYTGYEYNAGDVLVVVSDDIANFEGEIIFCYPTDSTVAYVNPIEGDGMVFYELPEATITTQPSQIRWKGTIPGTSASIKGMYIWDAETYKEFTAEQYDPNQVPQGVAVTYYDDIYSRGVAWNTDDTVPTSGLYYVKKLDDTQTADNVDWTREDVEKVENVVPKAFTDYVDKTWHTFKAVADNLEPGETYFFRVGSEEYGWSKVGSFNIEGASADIDSLHFIHLTDTQEENEAAFKKYAKVVKSAYELMDNAAFMVHGGDLVNNGEKLSFNEEDPSKNINDIRMQEWMYVLDAPKANLLNSVLMPTVGNHDCGQFVFTDRFNINWADYQEDDSDLKTGGCYSFTYGEPENGVLIISLNTNQLWSTAFQNYQQVWLEETLGEYNDYKWKIVQMHAGAITGGGHTNDGESEYLREYVMPIFSKYKVDLVLQGHDHYYTRSRSMAYGVNPFETENPENPVYYDGHTPVYLSAVPQTRTVNGKERTVYIEPQGTHYITINASGGKRYEDLTVDKLDPLIVEAQGENPINPKNEETGKGGSMCSMEDSAFALVSIEGDLLVYDVYTYNHDTGKSEMYDTFAVDKSSNRGYNPENPHEGKTEVQLYGIKVAESKQYDGHPVKLDLSGFNCSNPTIMDTASLKYTMEVLSGGVDPVTGGKYRFNPGNLKYGMMPKEPGTYRLTISVPQNNKDFYGSVTFDFTITQ